MHATISRVENLALESNLQRNYGANLTSFCKPDCLSTPGRIVCCHEMA
jgi:hypothetical protein